MTLESKQSAELVSSAEELNFDDSAGCDGFRPTAVTAVRKKNSGEWGVGSAEFRTPHSLLGSHTHASEAGDVGDAIDVAQLVNAFGQSAGGDEAVELDQDRPLHHLAQPR